MKCNLIKSIFPKVNSRIVFSLLKYCLETLDKEAKLPVKNRVLGSMTKNFSEMFVEVTFPLIMSTTAQLEDDIQVRKNTHATRSRTKKITSSHQRFILQRRNEKFTAKKVSIWKSVPFMVLQTKVNLVVENSIVTNGGVKGNVEDCRFNMLEPEMMNAFMTQTLLCT